MAVQIPRSGDRGYTRSFGPLTLTLSPEDGGEGTGI